MKAILFALSAILAVSTAYIIDVAPEHKKVYHLLGDEHCTWGPGFWCKNITNAAQCNATQHCIKKEWETMKVPEDHGSVCEICKDMVTQARDQLQSNQTQEDLKAVFEGSCKLMMVKVVIEECDKLVDQFVPELVETLASQMDPSVVCSVSGLCNSPRIDKLLLENEQTLKKTYGKVISLKNDEIEPDECSKCYTIVTHMEGKLKNTSKDEFVDRLLVICGNMGSFSDACSSIVLVHYKTLFERVQSEFKAKSICHLSGQCSSIFHQHEDETKPTPKVEIRPLSSVGIVDIGDDLPCKLCEQLVGHLKDLLVANTTEIEFKEVLEGFCKQTKSFASECISIVDQYYPEIYEYLVNGLKSNTVCEMAGICPAPGKKLEGPFMPLLPPDSESVAIKISQERKIKKVNNLGENGAGIRKYPKTEADEMQLPSGTWGSSLTLLGMPNMDVSGQKSCAICEFVLHELQKEMTQSSTESNIKQALGKVCDKIPNLVEDMCHEFVDQYGDAVIALLVQEIDPSMVCPMVHLCPTQQAMEAWDQIPKEHMLESKIQDKPSCPLCLLAVNQLYTVIKSNKTEENIISELDKLCSHLPKDLSNQCVELVKVYSKELIDMLLADMTPQEVCVALKLCDPKKNVGPTNLSPTNFYPTDKDGEIISNEIPYFPLKPSKPVIYEKETTKCVICETIMEYLEKAMSKKSTKDEIEKLIHEVCEYLPKSAAKSCDNFVNEYADIVITLLSQEVSPREICTLINACEDQVQQIRESVSECALCQAIISSVDNLLTNPKVDDRIEEVINSACDYIPPSKHDKCVMLLEVYEQSIINLLKMNVDTKEICKKMSLCSSTDMFAMTHVDFRNNRLQLRKLNIK
ncbi:prosaposin [Microplitis mediator]|uniref:prosaposin n=1 Tax=Microplitis mediator TaxID=375433 RepID=UPI00255703CB|nr:prosaposin [Microplitis mediator]XP_057325758.1 prosaposin [Microplitis mediator]